MGALWGTPSSRLSFVSRVDDLLWSDMTGHVSFSLPQGISSSLKRTCQGLFIFPETYTQKHGFLFPNTSVWKTLSSLFIGDTTEAQRSAGALNKSPLLVIVIGLFPFYQLTQNCHHRVLTWLVAVRPFRGTSKDDILSLILKHSYWLH